MKLGPVSVMFSSPNEHEGDVSPAFTGSLYFRVKEVDSLWTHLNDQARVCYPLETFPYGMREFAIYDNNGYLLQFGEESLIQSRIEPDLDADLISFLGSASLRFLFHRLKTVIEFLSPHATALPIAM